MSYVKLAILWPTLIVLIISFPAWSQSGSELDLRQFGAACNGLTNDAAAVQAAFNAVPNGGTILVPCQAGIGAAGARLSGKTNVTLRGTNGGGFRALAVTQQSITAFGPFTVVVDGCTNCVIRDLVFEQDHRNVGGLGVTRSTDTTVENVTIRKTGIMTGGALSASGNKRNRYIGNTIDWTDVPNTGIIGDGSDGPGIGWDWGTRGMWLGNPWDAAYEWEPYVARNHVKDAGHSCIAAHAVNDTYVENLVENCLGAGFKINPAGFSTKTIVEKNTARGNRFHGIQTQASANMIIRHNLFELNADGGVYFGHGQRDTVVHDNIIRNNDTYVGLRGLPDANANTWIGGVFIQGRAHNIEIRDNIIEETRSGNARRQTVAMRITSILDSNSNIRILRNTCSKNTVHGIYFEAYHPMTGIVIAGNSCLSNDRWGIQLEDKQAGAIRSDVVVCGNILTGNGYGPITSNGHGKVNASTCPSGTLPQPTLPQPIDTVPPAVNLTSPKGGATVSGTIIAAAEASDASGIASVQFKLEGNNLGAKLTSAPFTTSVDTTKFPNGMYQLTAEALDKAGNLGVSAPATITIHNVVAPPPPAEPLVISGVSASSVTSTSATIVWNLNRQADGRVVYGTTPSLDAFSETAVLSASHSITLKNLNSSTAYQFQVQSKDSAGTSATSQKFSFETSAPHSQGQQHVVIDAFGTPYDGKQAIMELRIGATLLASWEVTNSSRQYTHTTTDSTVAQANLRVYFVNDAWGPTGDRNLYVTSLSMNGTPLNTNASNVYSQSGCGSGYRQSIALYCNGYFEFPTTGLALPPTDTQPPLITGVTIFSITATSARVSWITNEPADGQVEYGTAGKPAAVSLLKTEMSTAHEIELKDLLPSTDYRLRVKSKDANGNLAVSDEVPFKTAAAPPASERVVVIRAYGSPFNNVNPVMQLRFGNQVLASWSVPTAVQNYTFKTTQNLGGSNLQVHFTNDAWGPGGDRNLYVHSLSLDGVTYRTDAPTVFSKNCSSGFLGWIGLYCNGYFEYPTSGPAGP